MVERARENAKAQLRESLGDDVDKIKSIALDAELDKFHQIDAPDFVVEKLRKADLLKE